MRCLSILVVLTACEVGIDDPGRATAGEASSLTTASGDSDGSSGEDSDSADGAGSTGDAPCLTPGGDPCPPDGECFAVGSSQYGSQPTEGAGQPGSVCVEPCSLTGQCRTGLTCLEGYVGWTGNASAPEGCYLVGCIYQHQIDAWQNECSAGMACTYDISQHACVWPE